MYRGGLMWVPALLVGCTVGPQDPRDPNDSLRVDELELLAVGEGER